MAPTSPIVYRLVAREKALTGGDWRENSSIEALILESWSQGCLVGALMIMSCVTVANMRRGILLHKLILLEVRPSILSHLVPGFLTFLALQLLLAITHGTFCFMSFEGAGWYLSSTAALLYSSYFLHNIIAWIKIRPFILDPRVLFGPKTAKIVTWVYLTTLAMTIPPMILHMVDNFLFFNNISDLYRKIRPAESLFKSVHFPCWTTPSPSSSNSDI